MTNEEARAHLDEVKRSLDQLFDLLVQSYESQEWQKLGYLSWRRYIKAEFGKSESPALRFVASDRVMTAVEAAVDPSAVGTLLRAQQARSRKPKQR